MNIFSEAKKQVKLIDVVKEYTSFLAKDGSYWKGVCPLTEDCKGDFTVNGEIFYCFGCHMGGDVISFLQKVEDCTPLEVIEFLKIRYSLTFAEERAPESSKQSFDKQAAFAFMKSFSELVYLTGFNDERVNDYCKKQGISAETRKEFMIGSFPENLDAKLIEGCSGLDIFYIDGGEVYSYFFNQVMMTLHDHLGRVAGFYGIPFSGKGKHNSTRNMVIDQASLRDFLSWQKKWALIYP